MVKIGDKDYITLKEFASDYKNDIGISYSRLRGLIKEGIITEYERVGNLIFIPFQENLVLLKKRKEIIRNKDLIEKRIKMYYLSKNSKTTITKMG